MKKPKCYNCKYAGKGFKINKLTYHVCNESSVSERIRNGAHTFEALMVFSDTCDNHEFETTKL